MSNNSHILNLKLDDNDYAALCAIKQYSGLPFTTIIRTLIRNEVAAGSLITADPAQRPVSSVSNATHTSISPQEQKFQYQLKLMQAREELRAARDERNWQKREQARLDREEKREAARLQKEADRLAREEKRKAEKKHKEVLKAIRRGDDWAGMSSKDYIAYHEACTPEQKKEIEKASDEYMPEVDISDLKELAKKQNETQKAVEPSTPDPYAYFDNIAEPE